jgi:hypothetical protein
MDDENIVCKSDDEPVTDFRSLRADPVVLDRKR